jgi:hypothetical protein
MTTLITAEQVINLAYGPNEQIRPSAITAVDIAEAEACHILPILGDALTEAIHSGKYHSLVEDYIAPALALWVRHGIEPMLHTRCGGDHSNTSTNSIALAQRTLHRKATTLTRRLCNILNRHRADFPEYDPHTNPLNRCSIYGDIIQIR